MSPAVFLVLSLAGGVGAACRLVLDGVIRSRVRGVLPWGTVTINLSGSLLLGLVAGLTTARVLPETWHVILGSGFLGGYTTFSTASVETVRLLQEGRRRAGLVNAVGTLVAATAAAALGLWLGSLV